jgi:hypothetical protein
MQANACAAFKTGIVFTTLRATHDPWAARYSGLPTARATAVAHIKKKADALHLGAPDAIETGACFDTP